MKEQSKPSNKLIMLLLVLVIIVQFVLTITLINLNNQINDVKQAASRSNKAIERLDYQQKVDGQLWDAQQKLNIELAQ